MSDSRITIVVVDEGYYRKSFMVGLTMDLKKLIDTYSTLLCPTCTDPEVIDFWYEATKVSNGILTRIPD
jgi:hypothetical protein